MESRIDIKFYAKNGYLLIDNFFELATLDRAFVETKNVFYYAMQRLVHAKPEDIGNQELFDNKMYEFFEKDSDSFINAGKQAQHTFSLWSIATSDVIHSLLKGIGIAYPLISVRPSFFFNSRLLDKTGHYWKLGDHQDWRSSQGSLDSVTIWYPYVDCDVSLGALEVIPGSHLRGLLECSDVDYYSKISKSAIDESEYISIEMKKGDLLIFNSFLVHRSGTNITNRIRWSSQLRYNNLVEPTFIARRLPNPYTYKPFREIVEPGPPSQEEIKEYFDKLIAGK